ncbi:SDR family oxidoreductase [Nonomuraea sp. K274]|uniref:SDR family oxidoreductase n=1 Tax=Nonomuraea cypriaca TaxID=1187855 RepID=A0A931AF16_9ACTN|nr:SDR family oxidoreductase [Nonomuraea cypriaca]MBF8190753.1 SDR family oxidoreductase [Nonomuraea cypriaca]
MDLGIAGKVAIVTAAGSGLGQAIARALAAEGVHVAVTGRALARLDDTVRACAASGVRVLPVEWDLREHARSADVAAQVAAELGPADILVNNTGGPPASPAAGQPAKLWEEQYAAMVLPVIGLTDAVLGGMRERGWGRILTSTSSGAIAPIPNLGISNTLRASLHGWSKTLSKEVAAAGITSNVIVPGRVATARTAALDEARAGREGVSVEEVERASRATIPAGRYGDPEEYGTVAAFLVSARAGYINGSVIRVDGGLIPSI